MQDFREENPKLHLFYTRCAIRALRTIDKAIENINALSSTAVTGILGAMYKQREELIRTNAAYAEAEDILKQIDRIDTGEKEQQD